MSKPVKQFVCVVDGWRRPSRQRNTHGRYRVGAKDEKSAKCMLQKAIRFGSVQVIFEDKAPKTQLALGECRKELIDRTLMPVFRTANLWTMALS